MPWLWQRPRSLPDGLAFLGPAGRATAGHGGVAQPIRHGPASVIAPFEYRQIVGAVLVGAAMTGLWPDGFTLAGATIIVAAGIGLAMVDRRR